MLVVINKIHWCVAVCAVNCTCMVDSHSCSHCSSHRHDIVVYAGCDKQDSLMRRRLCSKLYGGQSQLFTLQQSPTRQPDILWESRFLPPPHSMPPLGCPHQNIAITFGTEKLEWCGYLNVNKLNIIICMFIVFDRVHERDWRTDTIRRLCIASSGKMTMMTLTCCVTYTIHVNNYSKSKN